MGKYSNTKLSICSNSFDLLFYFILTNLVIPKNVFGFLLFEWTLLFCLNFFNENICCRLDKHVGNEKQIEGICDNWVWWWSLREGFRSNFGNLLRELVSIMDHALSCFMNALSVLALLRICSVETVFLPLLEEVVPQ